MSTQHKMSDIVEQKSLLVAKADLQRSTFLWLTSPFFKVVRVADIGTFAVRTGKAIARHVKRKRRTREGTSMQYANTPTTAVRIRLSQPSKNVFSILVDVSL